MKLLYMTYLSPDKPGTQFLESFNRVYSEADTKNVVDLLICYTGETPIIDFTHNHGQIILYSLDNDSTLRKWKKENHDVIPHFQGGEATKHSHPDLMAHPQNRALSKQMPNIVSLSHGWNSFKDNYDLLIWLDAKCYFKSPLPADEILHQTETQPDSQPSLYYFQAPKKLSITRAKCGESLETRFLAFTKDSQIIPQLIQEYQKKKFRDHPVWTPPFILKTLLAQNKHDQTQDLGKDLPPRSRVPLLDSANPIHPYISCQF